MDNQDEANRSSEFEALSVATRSLNGKLVAVILAVAYVFGSGFMAYRLSDRVAKAEESQKTLVDGIEMRNKALMDQMQETEASLKRSTSALRRRVGMTQRQLAARSAELRKQVNETEQELRQSQQLLASVSNDLGGVKTDLSSAKGDISATRTDLDATKKRLDSTIGDLGLQSGLIARTRDDLEVLKHKGDRNYYEFTLVKSKRPTPVGTVSLQLKKVNARKGNFTMDVIADDRVIEKKDRTVAEPLQFYTGRDRMLYEVVVFSANKKSVTGYLSAPKNAPAPGVIHEASGL
jgi:septal ring factor EnvC (AmiA/AmiB activator)